MSVYYYLFIYLSATLKLSFCVSV